MTGPPLLIRSAHVVTMEPGVGDLAGADVLIRDGSIAAVGPSLDAPGAEVLDGRDMIALPGLVDTHWHVWTTLLRSMAGDRPEHGYFPTTRRIGIHYRPIDTHRATMLAAAEAIDSGITFLHDWCHNVRGPEHAEASLAALGDSGIRARFSYGWPTGESGRAPIDLEHLGRLASRWRDFDAEGRLSLGVAWRGPGGGIEDAGLLEHRFARERELPITVHANVSQASAGGITALAQANLLGPDVQVIHAISCTYDEIAALAATGASVSVSPWSELRIGFGMPLTLELLDAGVAVGLSIDTPALCGNADMFSVMKAVQNVANARAHDERALPARRVLELATIGGARSLGLGGVIGSLAPGKRADVIMLDTRALNLAVLTDPAHLIVEAAQPRNVDTVIVDGRILKRGGRLTTLDPARIVAGARESNSALRERADWW